MFDFEFMRTEIWHALSVHFPIALLVFSTLAFLVSFFLKNENGRAWRNAAGALLYIGTITAWISVYTGNLADGVVARKICDPTILKDHEIAGQTMTYLFTAASLLSLLIKFITLKPIIRSISLYLILSLMLIGTGYLVYAGHLGAHLVYYQGAGVYNHDVDCSDYK
jgi:uncharacterized membrane protein